MRGTESAYLSALMTFSMKWSKSFSFHDDLLNECTLNHSAKKTTFAVNDVYNTDYDAIIHDTSDHKKIVG